MTSRQRFPVAAIRDAWYVYSLDAQRFDIINRVLGTGHTTWAAHAADLSPLSRAAYDLIVSRRDTVTSCHMPQNSAQRHAQPR